MTDGYNETVIASGSAGQLSIKSTYELIQEVTVYDVLGRQLLDAKNIDNNEFSSANVTLSQQTLIVKIKLENGVVVERKIVL
jgi:hypothetical protein